MQVHPKLCMLLTLFQSKKALTWRWILTLSIFFTLTFSVAAQEAVISSYFNAASPNDEWTEILVISDNLNMGGWYLHDNNSAQQDWQDSIVFNSIPFWNNMRAGTIIIIWHRSTSGTGSPHTLEVNKTDGYIELDASNATYFHGGVFTGNNNTMNIAASGDIYELKKPNYQHVHSLSHKTTVDSCYNNMPVPKLNYKGSLSTGDAVYVFPGSNLADYGTPAQNGTTYTAKGTDITFGLPNNSSSSVNSNFWRLTRQPVWTSPVLSATPNAAFTQVSLSWNTCADPYFSDGTVGYIILRNATNSFTDPADGTSYSTGATIGTATVVSNIASTGSPNYTYTDNITITCGNTIYYRIYAYRYSGDNLNISNPARGRAYNETFAAAPAIGPTATVTPVSITVDRNNFCADDPGDIVLTAIGGSGTSIEWFDDVCGGNLIGTVNSLTIP
ncbi:MAG: hypothetical protein ACOYMF_18490, partial [Bacteroidales bacterium]